LYVLHCTKSESTVKNRIFFVLREKLMPLRFFNDSCRSELGITGAKKKGGKRGLWGSGL
jgi:hypothetical protein